MYKWYRKGTRNFEFEELNKQGKPERKTAYLWKTKSRYMWSDRSPGNTERGFTSAGKAMEMFKLIVGVTIL